MCYNYDYKNCIEIKMKEIKNFYKEKIEIMKKSKKSIYAMDIFEGEGLSNNKFEDNIFYKLCINENPIQVPDQERKKKIERRRKETAWEEYQMEQKLGEEKITRPEREAERRYKRKEEPN